MSQHLARVCQYTNENKMTAETIAVIFGPTFCEGGKGPMAPDKMQLEFECVKCLIIYNEWVFS